MVKIFGGAKKLISASRRRFRRASSKTLQRFIGMGVSCQLEIPSTRFFLRRL